MIGLPALFRSLGLFFTFTALFSHSLGVQDEWVACPFSHILAKSTKGLGLLSTLLRSSVVP